MQFRSLIQYLLSILSKTLAKEYVFLIVQQVALHEYINNCLTLINSAGSFLISAVFAPPLRLMRGREFATAV